MAKENGANLPALVIAEETISALDRAAQSGLIASKEASQFKKMAMIAGSIGELRSLLTPKVMAPVMALQGSAIGFLTDKDSAGGYSVDAVKDCLIESTLRGVYPVGNEFNIIAGRCYVTKEGYGGLLRREVQNLEYMITPGIPRNVGETGAIVKMKIEWTLSGVKKEKELELCIKVNRGMGSDAIIGKATRKSRAWLYTTITGKELGEGEVGDSLADGAIDTTATPVSPFEKPPVDGGMTEEEKKAAIMQEKQEASGDLIPM